MDSCLQGYRISAKMEFGQVHDKPERIAQLFIDNSGAACIPGIGPTAIITRRLQ